MCACIGDCTVLPSGIIATIGMFYVDVYFVRKKKKKNRKRLVDTIGSGAGMMLTT